MPSTTRRLYLVSCVSQKQRKPMAARDLYCSDWFRKARAYVEAQSGKWFILSAKYGLVEPQEIIAPYEATLSEMSAAKRKVWADKVATELRPRCPRGTKVVVLAGRFYREHLVRMLSHWGCKPDIPLEGMGIGNQLSWFKRSLRPVVR